MAKDFDWEGFIKNVKVVDAKTGKKKRKATNTLNLENFMNFINMNYPKGPQAKDPSPAVKRNRRQSKKALKIINSRKKNPTSKKITPAQQKVINQAAPVIEKIKEGHKKGSPVKFAPEPKKPILKKAGGGKVKSRNMGGVIGGGLGSQDVVDYLYKYKS